MANKVISIASFTPSSSDVFFFDNNIWMYLLCPMGNFQKDKKQKEYSKFFSYVLSRELHIYTMSLVLAEFTNRYLRLDYDLQRKQLSNAGRFNDYKKDYVGSIEFTATVAALKTHVRQIMKVCQKSSDEFNSLELETILQGFEKIGFNDSYYATIAAKKRWIIVTDDSDFTRQNIPDLDLTVLTYQN